MRKSVSLVLALCLLLGASAFNPAHAGDAKPLVVLSLADYKGLNVETSVLKNVSEAPQIPACLESMLRLYIEGGNLTSLDATRPWGAVLQIDGEDLSDYAFVPVTDAEGLLDELSSHIDKPTDVGNGIFRIDSATDDKYVFAKVTDKGWIIVGENPDVLADAPADPGKLIKGLNKNYDFALRVNIANIPSYQGQFALDILRTQLNDQFSVETLVPEKTLDAIFEAAANLDQVTLGWSRHK